MPARDSGRPGGHEPVLRISRLSAAASANLEHLRAASQPPEAPQARAERERLNYLREVLGLLWPSPATITVNNHPGCASPVGTDAPDRPGSEFLLLPGIRRPRLLVPVAPRAAATAVRHYSAPRSRLARLSVKALSAGLASGVGATVLGGRIRVNAPAADDSIEAYLQEALACDIRVGMHVGPARANRKPVLQLLTAAGETIGFAKIGVSPLTRSLVCAEHDSLELLGADRVVHVKVPRVLHYGEWRDLKILVISPLPIWQRRRRLSAGQLAAAMLEVSSVSGLTSGPLDGAYLGQLRGRLAEADENTDSETLTRALDALTARAGRVILTYGAWHGDWTQWNMANTDQGLLLWDWERFTAGVPVGFDALHYWLHAEVGPGRHREPRAAAAGCADQAARLLSPFSVDPAQARLTTILYLADLATRYLADRQAKAGARRGAPGRWLIPAIADEVARL